MVFMSATIAEILLSDAQQAHLRMLEVSEATMLHQAFLTWLLPSRCTVSDLDGQIKMAFSKRGGGRSHRDVAIAGFASQKVEEQGLSRERDALVDWIQGTSVRTPNGFDPIVDDPAGFLGVMIAIEASTDTIRLKARKWLVTVCAEAANGGTNEAHSSTFRAIGQLLAKNKFSSDISEDVSVALQSKGLLVIDPAKYSAAFTKAKRAADEGDIYTAAIRLAALDWIQSQTAISIDLPDKSQVRRVLEGVQSSLYRWVWEEKPRTARRGGQARKWHIENEYHFQSLLYAVLRPVFPDLKEEEYTTSVGTTQPRADLYIPSLKLVVEVKFWYQRDNSRELINQLAADASLYRARGSEVQIVLPIIWDEGRRTEEHSVIQDGVTALDGLERAIFVNRPSTWKDATSN